ncbi:MAG: MFS transporter [Alphaproteobacteria bacterium]|nr:MFS transporter [Alphaproteobacteria bacterium]
MLCAAYVASQFYRVANAAIAPELMAELSLSAEAMGVVTGLFFLAFAAAQIPAGVLLDRFGPRRTMSGLFALAVLGALVFAIADGAALLGLGRVLIGLGCAAGLMGSMVVIARWYPESRFAHLSATLFVVGGAGTLLGTTPLAGAVEFVGWRGAFHAMAALTAVFALALYLVVRDAPPGRRHEAEGESWGEVWQGLRAVVANGQLWLVAAIQFVGYASVLTVIGLWGGPYLSDVHGLAPVPRGNMLLALNVAALAGVMAWGQIDRLVASRKWLIVSAACLTAAVLTVLALWPAPGLWLAGLLLVLFAACGSYVMLNHAFARRILPDHLVGRGLTFQNLAVFLGISAIQSASGVIVGGFESQGTAAPEVAYRAVFGFLAVLLVISALVFAFAREERARPVA